MRVRQFVDEGLGNSAHLVISERDGVAALIDPLRDVDQYQEVARCDGVRITHVFETHIHNDFVSGSRELAALTGPGSLRALMPVWSSIISPSAIAMSWQSATPASRSWPRQVTPRSM